MKTDYSSQGYSSQIYNLLYIFVAIIYIPVQMVFIKMDAAGRLMFTLTILIIIMNLKHNLFVKTLFSKPIIFWLLWVLFSTVNTAIKNPTDVLVAFVGFNFWNTMLIPLVVLVLTSMEYCADEIRLSKWALWAFVSYTFMGVSFMTMSTHTGQQDILSLGNGLGLNAMYIIFFIGLLKSKKRINSFWVLLLFILVFAIIIISAQRKAFGAVVILFLFYFLSNFKLNKKQLFGTVVLSVVLYVSFSILMSYSTLGERFEMVQEEGAKDNTTEVKALDFLGDRAVFYVEGWKLFEEYPITGIGLNNFVKLSGVPWVLHTEYMVQLTECGLIGSMLFVFLYWYLIRNLLKKRKIPEYRRSAIVSLGGVASILFIDITSWTYSSYYYFCILGVAVGVINKTKYQLQ